MLLFVVVVVCSCKPKNRVLVYDTLSTVCDALGSDILGEPAHATKLAGPIVNVLASCSDDSEQLPPLLECIASVARGGGEAFLPYAADVYARCLRLLHTSLAGVSRNCPTPCYAALHVPHVLATHVGLCWCAVMAAGSPARQGAPGGDVPDVVDGALDVTSAMFDALGARMSSIADTGVVDAVYACLRVSPAPSPPPSLSLSPSPSLHHHSCLATRAQGACSGLLIMTPAERAAMSACCALTRALTAAHRRA